MNQNPDGWPRVPDVVLLAVVAVMAVMQAITLRRYDRMNAVAQDQAAGSSGKRLASPTLTTTTWSP